MPEALGHVFPSRSDYEEWDGIAQGQKEEERNAGVRSEWRPIDTALYI